MAILIDMPMPTECRDCPMEMYHYNTGETICIASGEMLAYPYQTIQFEGRPDWCPLREVIRCGNCKFLMPSGLCTVFADGGIRPSVSDFCSYGERREP